jgi:hypothetical protein
MRTWLPSATKKNAAQFIWRRVQIPKLVSLLTLPASPCQSTQIDNTHNNSKHTRSSGSSSSSAKAYTHSLAVATLAPALTCPCAVA